MASIAASILPGSLRDEFVLPSNNDVEAVSVDADLQNQPCTYLCGNSLGALPRRAQARVQEEFQVWGSRGVEGHFRHPLGREWVSNVTHVNPLLAELLGANESEVACMGTLTANLHLMMGVFYKPTKGRYKILCEAKAFPSDQYAFASQALHHGLNPSSAIIEMSPRPGEYTLREQDILDVIQREGSTIALVLFPGVQYYTGQLFPMGSITAAAKAQGCICAWDLAHAIGNVPLNLHDWNVDFAVWCSYKYLNSGAGGIGGLFVHERWDDVQKPIQAGWWGHDPITRFAMPPTFVPIRGAQGFQQSNPSIFTVAALLGSLQVFKEAGMMQAIRKQSVILTRHLEEQLMQSSRYVRVDEVARRYPFDMIDSSESKQVKQMEPAFTIITPSEEQSRGAQLSLLFLPPGSGTMAKVYAGLKRHGVIGDERQPDVIRLAPVVLYNTLEDCERAARYLDLVFDELKLQ